MTESKAQSRCLELANIQDSEAVLEVAVGTGLIFSRILQRNPSGVNEGINLTEAMLIKAKQKAAQSGTTRYRLRPGDAYSLDFADDTFDLLINNYMFDLLPEADFPLVLSEFKRVLKPGGRLPRRFHVKLCTRCRVPADNARVYQPDDLSIGDYLRRERGLIFSEYGGSMAKTNDLAVFITTREAACSECGEDLGRRAWITLTENKEALCLACADLDHLVFLPAGDAALTRRSRKHSTLLAVVLQWSRARKRYERQGLLVEEAALAQAEEECLADADARARRRERAAVRRAELDEQYVAQFAQKVRDMFPNCPPQREKIIAEHACLKYSGRVGRSAAAKQLDENSVRLAVSAHIRHAETPYDRLLAQGFERWMAREQVEGNVAQVLERWRK